MFQLESTVLILPAEPLFPNPTPTGTTALRKEPNPRNRGYGLSHLPKAIPHGLLSQKSLKPHPHLVDGATELFAGRDDANLTEKVQFKTLMQGSLLHSMIFTSNVKAFV